MRISAALVTTRHSRFLLDTRSSRDLPDAACRAFVDTDYAQIPGHVQRRGAHTLVNYHANDLGVSFEKVEIE